MKTEQQQRMYDAMKEITRYQTTNQFRKGSNSDWGLDYEEALEMAYENIQETAKRAVKGLKRPV